MPEFESSASSKDDNPFSSASTVDGYRSAIADKLGNSPIDVIKDENLASVLNGFHGDTPKGPRGIPSWKLSLVLHQLKKAPFEPLKAFNLQDCDPPSPGFCQLQE